MNIEIIPIRTRAILPPRDNIYKVIDEFVPELREGDVFVITSKILAIHQGRCLLAEEVKDKDILVAKEADLYVPQNELPDGHIGLTIKGGTLIAFAGIDVSNANGYYILWPNDPFQMAKEICLYLKQKFSLKNLAVIVSDSHCIPLRRGTTGISIGFYGLNPLKDYRKKTDIFGREMKITQANIVDAITSMAVAVMGEGSEQQPLAILRGADFIEFTDNYPVDDFKIPLKEDLFYPLLDHFRKPVFSNQDMSTKLFPGRKRKPAGRWQEYG